MPPLYQSQYGYSPGNHLYAKPPYQGPQQPRLGHKGPGSWGDPSHWPPNQRPGYAQPYPQQLAGQAPASAGSGAQNSPYGTQQGSSPFGAQPEYGYQSGPAIIPGGPPARPAEDHTIDYPGWNPQLGRDENLHNLMIQQLIAQKQSAYGDKLSGAGIPGEYNFSVGNSPGRVLMTPRPQPPPRYTTRLVPASPLLLGGATAPGAIPSSSNYSPNPYQSQYTMQGGQQGGQQGAMLPQLLALLQQLQGNQQKPQGF